MRIRGIDAAGFHLIKAFDVAIEDPAMAIAAVRAAHPQLDGCHMQAVERLSATAVAFLELHPGEVKERLSLEPD